MFLRTKSLFMGRNPTPGVDSPTGDPIGQLAALPRFFQNFPLHLSRAVVFSHSPGENVLWFVGKSHFSF